MKIENIEPGPELIAISSGKPDKRQRDNKSTPPPVVKAINVYDEEVISFLNKMFLKTG